MKTKTETPTSYELEETYQNNGKTQNTKILLEFQDKIILIIKFSYPFGFKTLNCSGDWLNNNVNILNTTELYTTTVIW